MSAKDGHLLGDDYRRKFSQLLQFFQLAAIFQRRDGARVALKNESTRVASPCLFTDFTLLCDFVLTTLRVHRGESGDVMKVVALCAHASLFREFAHFRNAPFFSSAVIN